MHFSGLAVGRFISGFPAVKGVVDQHLIIKKAKLMTITNFKSSCDESSLSAAKSVVEKCVENVAVECEEDGETQKLVPKYAAQENDNLEGYEDALHGQEPGVDVVS